MNLLRKTIAVMWCCVPPFFLAAIPTVALGWPGVLRNSGDTGSR